MQSPQPWLSDLIWAQIPVNSLPKLSFSFALLLVPAPAGPPGCVYLFCYLGNELAVLQEVSALVALLQRVHNWFR